MVRRAVILLLIILVVILSFCYLGNNNSDKVMKLLIVDILNGYDKEVVVNDVF